MLHFNADQSKILPLERTISEGMNAWFSCSSRKKVYWYYEDNTERYFYGKTLVISKVSHRDQGRYECESTNEQGDVFRAKGLLKVRGKIVVYILCYSRSLL